MTGQMRDHIRRQRHMAALGYAQAWIRAHGAPDCELCGNPIAVQLPGKKFCSARCQKVFNARWTDQRANHHRKAAA